MPGMRGRPSIYFLLQITMPASQRRRRLSWVGKVCWAEGMVCAQTWGSPDLSKGSLAGTQSRAESQAVTRALGLHLLGL